MKRTITVIAILTALLMVVLGAMAWIDKEIARLETAVIEQEVGL